MSTAGRHRIFDVGFGGIGHEKTAYVGDQDLEYGLLRMYRSMAEMSGVTIPLQVFRTLQEARDWLHEGVAPCSVL
jgi:hypothetical protein